MANEQITDLAAINLDDIAEIGSSVPVGQYHCKLSVCNGKLSKKRNPMLEVRYEVIEGPQSGEEIAAWYTLTITRSAKNGKMYSPGLQEIKAVAAATNATLPVPFPLDATLAAQALGTALVGKHLDVRVLEDERDELDAAGNKTGNKIKGTRAKVIGLWKGPEATTSVTSGGANPLAGMV